MLYRHAVRLLSTASLLSFCACLLFATAALAGGMRDGRLVLAAVACLVWSYAASRWAESGPWHARDDRRSLG